jgi:hypothetical protein
MPIPLLAYYLAFLDTAHLSTGKGVHGSEVTAPTR